MINDRIESTTGEVEIERSIDKKEEMIVQFFDEKLIIGEETIDQNHPLGKYKINDTASTSAPIGTTYVPRYRKEKVKYYYKNHCFRNPSYPNDTDVKIINEGIEVNTKLRRTKYERKPKPDFNLKLIYCNLETLVTVSICGRYIYLKP